MTDWPHAPPHRFCCEGTYIITAATYNKEHLFKSDQKLEILHQALISLTAKYEWELHAWAVFSNHYHFVANSIKDSKNLPGLISELHCSTARKINEIDQTPNRGVWCNYWDTRLTFHKSYLARLNYVHNNPVKHGLVKQATLYPWCSARWFEVNASSSFQKSVRSFGISKLNIDDDF